MSEHNNATGGEYNAPEIYADLGINELIKEGVAAGKIAPEYADKLTGTIVGAIAGTVSGISQAQARERGVTPAMLLERIDKIIAESGYLQELFSSLSKPVAGAPPVNTLGIANAIEQREKTNRQMLAMLERMYNDMTKPPEKPIAERISEAVAMLNKHSVYDQTTDEFLKDVAYDMVRDITKNHAPPPQTPVNMPDIGKIVSDAVNSAMTGAKTAANWTATNAGKAASWTVANAKQAGRAAREAGRAARDAARNSYQVRGSETDENPYDRFDEMFKIFDGNGTGKYVAVTPNSPSADELRAQMEALQTMMDTLNNQIWDLERAEEEDDDIADELGLCRAKAEELGLPIKVVSSEYGADGSITFSFTADEPGDYSVLRDRLQPMIKRRVWLRHIAE